MPMVLVTPIDEMVVDHLVVHPALLVNPIVIRKIESVEIAPPKPFVPAVVATDKETIADPPANTGIVPPAPLLVTMITFLDGKQMHVKEDMATLKQMV